MKKLFILCFLTILAVLSSLASELNIIDLSQEKWEYKWGDSPFEKSVPLWTTQSSDTLEWKAINYPSNPPNRNSQTNVWYRVKLPEVLTKDPHVYIFSVDLNTQVYINGKQIYHFGEFDKEGKGEYQGWPWHMFSLPDNAPGEYLYFRVYSHYLDVGLFGELLVASQGDIYEKILGHDIPKLMVGAISIFVSLLFLLLFLAKLKRFELLVLGLLFLTQGLDVLCNVKIIQLYLFFPLLKQYILAVCFFSFPLGMALFMDITIKYKIPFNLIRRVWQAHLLYLLCAILGALFGFFDIASTYEYFDILYYLITMPILTICMIYFFFKGDNEIKLITSSFLIISIYWIISFLIAYSIVPWAEYPIDIAVFISLLLLSYSVVKKLHYTNELEDEKKYLSILSSTDYLTKLLNRKEIDKVLARKENLFYRYKDVFSIIILDIDNFKEVNDNHGHLVGDNILIEIANILTKFTRETDLVGRWGGEEFMIICPQTNKEEVLVLAEHLRRNIEEHQFAIVGKKTASFGVTVYKEELSITNLISQADEALYVSKAEGKNRVNFK